MRSDEVGNSLKPRLLFHFNAGDIDDFQAQFVLDAPMTKTFFATVQNKLHWAITGQTAAELIYSSADATKIYMGLASGSTHRSARF